MNILKQLLQRFYPFMVWLPELKNTDTLRADIMAGITVALVLIPQSMAYAQLAGLPAYYGLYAAFMPPMIGAIFGSSRQLGTGPVAVVSLLTAAALEPLAAIGSEGFVAYALLLSLIVGSFQMALGLLRLGVLVNFLSHPVIVGFTNAAAIIIATSQLSKIFGVTVEKMPHHYETVMNVLSEAMIHTHLPTLLMAILAFSIMWGLKRYYPKVPNVLVAVAVTTTLAWAIGFQTLDTVKTEQILANDTQVLLKQHTALNAQVSEINSQIRDSEQKMVTALKQDTVDAQTILSHKHQIETLRLSLNEAGSKLKTAVTNLKATPLYSVMDTEGKRQFYLEGQQPEGAELESYTWHISEFGKAGEMVVHAGGKVVGDVPSGLPSPQLPSFDLDVIMQLIAAAITIALIGFMEAISIAKAMAAKTRQKLDANQELVGQGMANIVGGIFQSYPASGSFSRSAVNFGAGAVTGFSSIVTSIVVVITLLFFTPLLYNLPQATLAAVIMMAVFGLINFKSIKHAWQVNKSDGFAAVTTFVLTLAFAPHLDKGIIIGVILSLALFLLRSMKPRVVFLRRNKEGGLSESTDEETCKEVSVIRFEGSLYFANTSYFEERIQGMLADNPDLKFLLIDGVSINHIDASGEEMLQEIVRRLDGLGIKVLFTRIKTPMMAVLEGSHFVEFVGQRYFFRKPQQAFEYIGKEMGEEFAQRCALTAK
jgi:MFS superfamily sulfate permease-like transporter